MRWHPEWLDRLGRWGKSIDSLDKHPDALIQPKVFGAGGMLL